MTWLSNLWDNTFVLRKKYNKDLDRAHHDSEVLRGECSILRGERDELIRRLDRVTESEMNTRKRFIQVTDKLHSVPAYHYEFAEMLAQLLRYILWSQEMTRKMYGDRLLFEYPISFKGLSSVEFRVADPTSFYASQDDGAPGFLVQETARFRAVPFTIAFSGDVVPVLIPEHGPWDETPLPFDKAEGAVRDKLRVDL